MKTYENGTHYDFDEPKKNVGDVIKWRLKDVTGVQAFYLGNIIKYILRRKGSDKADLIKARNYMDEFIESMDDNKEDVSHGTFLYTYSVDRANKLGVIETVFTHDEMLTGAFSTSEREHDWWKIPLYDTDGVGYAHSTENAEYIGYGFGKELV